MKTDDFDYYLPEELIAQVPLEHREESRLLVMDRDTGKLEDKKLKEEKNQIKEDLEKAQQEDKKE